MDSIKAPDNLLDSDITDMDSLMPSIGKKWLDSIEYAVEHNSEKDEFYYSGPSLRTRADHIHRRLGHIVVNPNNEYSSKAIIESYVFQNDTGTDGQIVNYSYEDTKRFVEELVTSAQQQYELSHSSDEIDRTGRSLAMTRFFILHGERGIGKTFYLNYLLSKFSQYFDQNRVIWVRLNLVQNFGEENNLKHWIYSQATKIIFRYYDEKSDNYNRAQPKKYPISDIAKRLSEIVNSSEIGDKEYKFSLYESITGMKQVFHSIKGEEIFSPALVPLSLGREVVKIARSHSYKFIVVLDGLDRLEMTEEEKKKFEGLVHQIKELAESNDLIGMTFLVATRTNTLNLLHGTQVDPYKFSQGRANKLANIPLSRILDKRLEFLKKEVQALATTVYKKYPDWNIADWPQHIEDFKAFLYRKEETSFYVEKMEKIYGANKRAQMQMVQMNYYEFLSDKKEHPYQLIESLVKSGRRFPPKYSVYTMNKNKKMVRVTSGLYHQIERRYFPILFDFPCIPYEDQKTPPPTGEGILMGLRCLQLMRAHQKISRQMPYTSPLFASELAELCKKLFGYPEQTILLLIYEYADFELCRLSGQFFLFPSSVERYKIDPLPKMDYLIDRFLYDIAYLNLCAMRLPLSEVVFKKNVPFISAVTFDNPTKDDLKNWIAKKILNAIAVYRLVKKINTNQIQVFDRNKVRIKDSRLLQIVNMAQKENMFSFISQMRSSIDVQIRSALTNLKLQGHDIVSIEKRIEEYKTSWQKI